MPDLCWSPGERDARTLESSFWLASRLRAPNGAAARALRCSSSRVNLLTRSEFRQRTTTVDDARLGNRGLASSMVIPDCIAVIRSASARHCSGSSGFDRGGRGRSVRRGDDRGGFDFGPPETFPLPVACEQSEDGQDRQHQFQSARRGAAGAGERAGGRANPSASIADPGAAVANPRRRR